MTKKHDYDAAWKSILEVFEVEVVELLFPEIFNKIVWELGTESLDKELLEIQKDIFDKDSAEKVISDKIIKVTLKDKGSKILFIHVEVQSYSSGNEVFGERMFRYFYRIWDKFRYKNNDESEIVAAAIYTYKGDRGKDKRYVYKLPELENEILIYNFKTIDVEKIKLEKINDDNPLKLVFKMAKSLLETGVRDEDIIRAKIKLAAELRGYDKVKNNDQIKALVDFLEYLFLIENPEIEKEYEEYKKENGGAFKLSIDEIRKLHYKEEGREEGEIKKAIEIAKKLLRKGVSIDIIVESTDLTVEEVEDIKKEFVN
ncbi:MAG: Rpn family recombination-promoting nuclease/putative transposase [Clostridium sp.]|uniref:Rpn family recombination-promoting nuclease/putative transposase n=1 Tax=Clostridium sp. TaxID=1506 RepID=UPI003D6D90BC